MVEVANLHVITGATGLLGSHVAEQLVARGQRVRALVRDGSNDSFLLRLGVDVIRGNLSEPASLVPFVSGAGVVSTAPPVSATGGRGASTGRRSSRRPRISLPPAARPACADSSTSAR
jgi:uncharacterized protein YbjT (DUF2867 family)